MTLTTRERLGARVHVGQVLRLEWLITIMKSLGHDQYIEFQQEGFHIDHVDPSQFPFMVRIVEITERENQIWSIGKMIVSTHIKVEGYP